MQLLQTETAHGSSAARNVGLENARGDFLTFLDDDVWLPANITTQLAWLERHPAAGAVWALSQRTTPDLVPFGAPIAEGSAVSGWLFETLLASWPQLGAALARAEAARAAGRFDESLLAGEDWDWLLRIAKRWPMGWIETPVLLFRQRASTNVLMMQGRLRDAVLVLRDGIPARYPSCGDCASNAFSSGIVARLPITAWWRRRRASRLGSQPMRAMHCAARGEPCRCIRFASSGERAVLEGVIRHPPGMRRIARSALKRRSTVNCRLHSARTPTSEPVFRTMRAAGII